MERYVKSMKAITFHILYIYSTLRIDNVVKLCNEIYNLKGHRSLENYCPRDVHFDKHIACKIARLNSLNFQKHRSECMAAEAKLPIQDTLKIGQKVKLRMQRSIFRKHQPLKLSLWSENVYRIVDIDRNNYPYLYSIDKHHKRFYAFELLALPEIYPIDIPSIRKSKILVDSYHFPSTPYLRSGKTKKNTDEPIYSILKQGQVQSATKAELANYKHLMGENSLAYSSFFNDPKNAKFIV